MSFDLGKISNVTTIEGVVTYLLKLWHKVKAIDDAISSNETDIAAQTDVKVGIDSGATAGYLGAAYSDGVLRTDQSIDYTDGGDYATLGVNVDDSTIEINVSNEVAVKADGITDTEINFAAFDSDDITEGSTNLYLKDNAISGAKMKYRNAGNLTGTGGGTPMPHYLAMAADEMIGYVAVNTNPNLETTVVLSIDTSGNLEAKIDTAGSANFTGDIDIYVVSAT